MKVHIACDGAVSNNGGESPRAGGGAVIEIDGKTHLLRFSHDSIAIKATKYGYSITNNTAELISLGLAFNYLFSLKLDPADIELEVLMDSEYAVKLLRKENRSFAKANVGLVEALRRILDRFLPGYQMVHGHGHVGIENNEIADGLAQEGKAAPDSVTVIEEVF